MSNGINYADFGGIHSLAGAIIFAILYVPLFFYFLRQSIRRPTYVFIVLTVFCLIRVTSFVLRAVLAGSSSAAQNLNLYIAEQVIYNVGFFGVLYSAYTLVLDRELVADPDGKHSSSLGPLQIITRLMRNRHLIRLTLMAAVVLGIIGATDLESSNPSEVNTGTTLRRASIYIFLVVACLLLIETLMFAMAEHTDEYRRRDDESFGLKHGVLILLGIALLLVMREAFFAATSTNASKQDNEHLWYPLSALPELLAATLFMTPGLVPARTELPETRSVWA
ncbi:hypothetical protein CERSUDRAFT_118251 [Gelatoporia subvermispora B]|uniref:DUF7702 domain-containing protein n=1 Tax=Ceriporiopsis subvermispora (strain B) TaxID=914234 RepID=M2R4Q7_CERS8|nr:hypothetical protein CERSUDRAFT_118251 [Gelatoporia subvermispora B]